VLHWSLHKKRKHSDSDEEPEGAASTISASKKRAIISSTTPLRSSSRTSMLKSPGGLSRNYTPLNIIVTSPKVHKEIDATDQSKIYSHLTINTTSSSLTSPRRNKLLHEELLPCRATNSSTNQKEEAARELEVHDKRNHPVGVKEM
jgi:hypothetical protein